MKTNKQSAACSNINKEHSNNNKENMRPLMDIQLDIDKKTRSLKDINKQVNNKQENEVDTPTTATSSDTRKLREARVLRGKHILNR